MGALHRQPGCDLRLVACAGRVDLPVKGATALGQLLLLRLEPSKLVDLRDAWCTRSGAHEIDASLESRALL